MRYSYTFTIEDSSAFIKQLLEKSKALDYISILDSNSQFNTSELPEEYVNYDLIVGVDALEVFDINDYAFSNLKSFHKKHKDWMFGYLSYDLKNELEALSSKNYDGIKPSQLSFFIPKYVLLLKAGILEVHTFESKMICKQFLDSLESYSEEEICEVSLQARDDKKTYMQKIAAIKDHIQRGDIYEMNYCQEFFAEEIDLNPQAVFEKLNSKAKAPFTVFLKMIDLYAMCGSPERFIKKTGDRLVSQPIKGTRKRGADIFEDKRLIEELKKSDKDISENIMITDLVRNDMSITASKGSVKVPELCSVYTFEKVHQMITTITANISEEVHFTEILSSVFPMGSMTGAPKLRAMELIEQFEDFKRGLFSGAIGYITPKGDFDFNVVIRTILYNAQEKYLSIGVGGAITIKSDVEEEFDECLVKAKPIFEVLNFQLNEN